MSGAGVSAEKKNQRVFRGAIVYNSPISTYADILQPIPTRSAREPVTPEATNVRPEHKTIPGMLSVNGLRTAVDDGSIDTVILGFPDLYGRLMGKRLDASFFLTDVAGGTHACDYLFSVDMEMEPVTDYEFSSWDLGYGDVHLAPDLGTLRKLSWLDRTALVICDAQLEPEHEPVTVAPRSILRRQLERLRARGFEAMTGSELEYYQYRTSYLDAARSGYRELTEVGWYLEDYHLLQGSRTEDLNGAYRRHLAASGIPVESTKGEFGRGQHELNIRYAPILEMAWSPDNRTAGFRVVGTGPSLRIECRIAGADVNPYLAYAAVIASGLTGIEQQIEPPPAYIGDVYAAFDKQMLPGSLEQAVRRFGGSDLARSAFGEDVVAHYAHFFTTEAEAYRKAVTDWERTRYFERI